jgi:methanethiol oxidase
VIAPFGAVPPLVTDINLSLDDRFLYVSCWGTGELRQYDVSDPFNPRFMGSVASAASCAARRTRPPEKALNGGPQMVEVSRDGRRVYFTNSLYTPVGRAVLPRRHPRLDGEAGRRRNGGIAFDERFFVEFEDGLRPHQVRLEGGDASSDSFCYARSPP